MKTNRISTSHKTILWGIGGLLGRGFFLHSLLFLLSGCTYINRQMTMTTGSNDKINVHIFGTGTATIDWGDGTIQKYTLLKYGEYLESYLNREERDIGISHNYSTAANYTITISGKNITYLDCGGNQLTSLDVSKNTALETLSCYNNQLTALDVSQNIALIHLYCGENQLTSLDLSKNTALTDLNYYGNQLTVDAPNALFGSTPQMTMTTGSKDRINNIHIDGTGTATIDWGDGTIQKYSLLKLRNDEISEYEERSEGIVHHYATEANYTITIAGENITHLECFGNNQLTSLDVSQNTALTLLDCGNNQLTSLDVSQNTALTLLDCGNNQLTSLDVSNNTALSELRCHENQLTADALNALFGALHSNRIVHKHIYIRGNSGIDACDQSIATAKGWTVFTD